ncbi:CBS domain-containing protein [Candidatus Altiarchaeota archaeon]
MDREGEAMEIANREVVSTTPTNSIKNVAQLMEEHDFRRLPVLDAGTQRLEGMAVAIDILNFLGGGEKYNIIKQDYNGNFLAAINTPISKIIAPASFIGKDSSIDEVIEIMLNKRTSAIPVVNNSESREVLGIITERDLLPKAIDLDVSIAEIMRADTITSSLGMMISDVSKIMVRNRLRRLPVIREDKVIGIVTVFDVLKFLEKGDFKGVSAEENLSTRVDEIMEKRVVSLKPEDSITEVLRLIEETSLGGFPVVSENMELKGILTTTDVIRWAYGPGA